MPDRPSGTELAWMIVSTLVAGAIAAFAEPLPDLAREIESDLWTRGIEFVVLLLLFWTILSGFGVIRAGVEWSRDGFKIQRLAAKTSDDREAVETLKGELPELHAHLRRIAAAAERVASALAQEEARDDD